MSSRSSAGTKKTTPFIDQTSSKYIPRSSADFKKKGNLADGTDGAHIFGFGLMNTISTHTSGRPLGQAGQQELIRGG